MLRHLFLAAMHERIIQHLIDGGATVADAHATAASATAGGVGGVFQWIIKNAPELYAVARFIALMFGIPLPPFPFPVPPAAA